MEDLVVLVAAADMLVALDQVLELEHHSQELSEQHHLLDGDILDQTVMGSGGGGAGGGGQPLGPGGHAIQLPATFRDPASTIGAPGPTSQFTGTDSSGKFWVAGGGAGGNGGNDTGGGPNGPHGGAGDTNSATADDALSGTGSGGGGSGPNPGSGGKGGSGLVLISYPT